MIRSIHVLLVSVFVLLVMSPAAAQTPSLQEVIGGVAGATSPTTIHVAKEFLTMNSKQPRAEAVAIRGGRFVAVGTLEEVKAFVGKDAKIDRTFDGKVVMAGFVEQHVHPVLAALTMNTRVISIEDWDSIDGFSPAVRDEKGYQDRLVKALTQHKDKNQPFVTWGYHHYFHGKLSRDALTRMAPDFPVIVWHRSCHEFYLNDMGLKLIGVDNNYVARLTPSQKSQLSLENGHFYEQGAMAILGKLAPVLASPAQFRAGLEFTERYYHRTGITVACEPGGFFSRPLQDAINSVYSDHATPFNHYFIADGKSFAARNPNDPRALVADTEQVLSWGEGRTAYLPKQVKLLTDGAIYSQLMMMKEGYTDGHKGAWIMDPPVFGYAFQTYWDAGYQIHIHNNGDAGLDVLLDNLARAMKRNPREDHRTVIVHFGFATPEQITQAAKLGAIVSANPYYVTALAGRYAKLGIGPERASNMVPLGDVVKNNISLSFHSDMPMAPAKPLQLVWAAVNRLTVEGEVMGAQHRVSVERALRAITIDAAFSIQLEKEVGSIEVGKRANLTILEKSPFEVAPKEIKDIGVWGTVLEGRVQPVKSQPSTGADSRSIPPSGVHPSTRVLGWNTREARMDSSVSTRAPLSALLEMASSRTACKPGCACALTHHLGDLIVRQMKLVR